MRNILIILTLCLLTLTTSSVFAEGFDESKRSERLGLSFYDGRPLYVASFTVPYVSGYRSNFDLYRVNSGDSLSNYGDFDSPTYSDCRCEYVRENGVIVQRLFFFYCVDDDGEPVLLGGESEITSNFADLNFVKKAFASATFTAGSGDVAIDIFDALLKPLQDWLGGALGFWLAIGVVFLGRQYLRRLVRGGVAIGGKSAELAANDDFLERISTPPRGKARAEQEREKFESFQKAWEAVRELGEADAYATGEAFGLTFTYKVVKSNQILQEAWSRLSEDERRFLANEARALAWQDDLIGEKEKIYRQVVMETAFIDLDGVAASSVFSNPFEEASYDYDENGGTPF